MHSILLSGAVVVDGTGLPRRRSDVLTIDGKIADVGSIPPSAANETVDCSGLTVTPGFIDVHSHSDQEILHCLPNKVLQGVTTEVVGNCGFSLFPTRPNPAGIRLTGEIFDGEPPEGMSTAADYFSAYEQAGGLVNVAALTGHVALRVYVQKMQREVSKETLQSLEHTLETCLGTGSIGFSTGLNCAPSSFANFDELTRLCRMVHRYGGLYTTHLRDYKFRIVEAVDEAIALARVADVPIQISHLQVVGRKNWEKLDRVLEQIDGAFQQGIDIGVDAYPYLAGSCSLIQFLPDWCQIGGLSALVNRLASISESQEIASQTEAGMSNSWNDLVISNVRTLQNKSAIGKSIEMLASERGKTGVETALDLLREEEGFVYVISFNQNEQNLRRVLTHPLASVITDGMVTDGAPHPRSFGAYPKFLGEYVREKQWLSLEEAIVKTSALPARQFRFRDRGILKVGNWADIAVFDANRIGTRADYDNPVQDPEGIHHVLVNGQFVVRDGKLTSQRPGVALRSSSPN
ncbi:MAG: D-aminoacylase [Acidobacteria bacterium]|nr:D-aminoacylase [Acidobacteriota bacterium]MCI0722379.1 D-aminoacylase [Acidobacteriota bacterium]